MNNDKLIERLTYAIGQVKAYGYLNARGVRMFSNAGIPLVKQLAEYYTELEGRLVSTADVYDRIKKKAVSYEDVMRAADSLDKHKQEQTFVYVVTRCEEHSDCVEKVFVSEEKAVEYCIQFNGRKDEHGRDITKIEITT